MEMERMIAEVGKVKVTRRDMKKRKEEKGKV